MADSAQVSTVPTTRRANLCFFAILAIALSLGVSSTARKSVTTDEFTICPNGLLLWRYGAFHLDNGVPPLAKMLVSLPLLLTDAHTEPEWVEGHNSGWRCGRYFAAANAGSYHTYFFYCRLVSLACFAALGLLVFAYGRRLYGEQGGLLAGGLTVLMPIVISLGQLAVTDIFVVTTMIAACAAMDLLLRSPTVLRALALGTAMGLASLFKYTGILLFVFLPLTALLVFLAGRTGRRSEPGPGTYTWSRRTVLGIIGALALACVVIDIGFIGSDVFWRMDSFKFETPLFCTLQDLLPAGFRPPIAGWFIKGLDTQLAEKGYLAYLMGEVNRTGFPHYYVVGLLVKTPLVVLFLCALAAGVRRRIREDEWLFILSAIGFFLFFSLASHKNIGVRYVLFVYPVMALWIARLVGMSCGNTCDETRPWRRHTAWTGLAVVLAIAVLEWPHYLPFFNLAAGGNGGGHRIFLDSNLDWGQDLVELREYMRHENIEKIDLAYGGRVDPAIYGIRCNMLVDKPTERYAAIGANLLWGRPYFVNGSSYWPADPDAYAQFRSLTPKAILGYSIYVYDLEEETGGRP